MAVWQLNTTRYYQYLPVLFEHARKSSVYDPVTEKRPSWSHLDLPKGILCRKICNAKVYHQNIGAIFKNVPSSSPFRVHSIIKNTVASSFSFSISSISMPVLEGNFVSCFLTNFPTFYTVSQHTSQNSPIFARLLQFIQRETFCVSVAVHQKDLAFPQIQRDAIGKRMTRCDFYGI